MAATRGARPGLTLLELVVVLAILAVLTLLAVVSTDAVVDQGRYDVTRRTLDNVQLAALGPLNQTDADGTRAVTGFVADTGRLPLAVGTDPVTQLAELWDNPRGIVVTTASGPAAFGLVAAPSDADVKLLVGWRGPYLRLPPQPAGSARLLDGWGNPFLVLRPDGGAAGADDPVAAVRSGGGPAAPYNLPMDLPQPFLPENYTGTVAGALTDSDPTTPATGDVTVRLYLPDVSLPGSVRELTATATAATGYRFEFPAVPIGPKAVRAYQGATKGEVIHIRVPAGGLTRNVPLDLR